MRAGVCVFVAKQATGFHLSINRFGPDAPQFCGRQHFKLACGLLLQLLFNPFGYSVLERRLTKL
ncbi:hypothetical protein T4B_9815 [Trichinella pseudospiralis]|uniref:Uncharacterized protein n=1 Tax=Trichinella pseudospiralis TaxID=6337 RepID=A0A0V1IWH2_TRIPS|nr:hypothetical protein T4B_9815 [Trichinella pseudospiralis]